MEFTSIIFYLLAVVFVMAVGVVVLAGLLFFFGRRHIYRLLKPNPHDIARDLARLRRLHPAADADELARLVIKQTALFLGLVGVFSGLGGFITTIIGTPLDVSVSTLRQMKMAHVITAIYGNEDIDPDALEIRYMSLVLGGAGAAKLLLFVLLKLLGNTVPFLGSLAGFGINWFFTRSIGEAAIAWNRQERLRDRAAARVRQLKTGTVNTVRQTVRPDPQNILRHAPDIAAQINAAQPTNVAPPNLAELPNNDARRSSQPEIYQ